MPKAYQVQDKYFRMAKEEGFRARSAFKLLEIQDKFHIIKPGQMVLDLGAAPGSFLQIVSRFIGRVGLVFGVVFVKLLYKYPAFGAFKKLTLLLPPLTL